MPRQPLVACDMRENTRYPHKAYTKDWGDEKVLKPSASEAAIRNQFVSNLQNVSDSVYEEINPKLLEAAGLVASPSIRSCFELPERGSHLSRRFPVCPSRTSALIEDWQRILREFLYSSPQLDSLVSTFVHKTVLMGVQNWNWAMSTMMDLTWAVLILSWEAFQSGDLPSREEDANFDPSCKQKSLRERYEDLRRQFHDCRSQWLDEVQILRDLKRKDKWTSKHQQAFDAAMEQDVYRFLPEATIEEEQKPYFQAAFEEALKVAIMGLKGPCPFCSTRDAELERLREEVDALKAKAPDSSPERSTPRRRLPEKPDVDRQLVPLQKEISELRQTLDAWRSRGATIDITELDVMDDARWSRVLERLQRGSQNAAEAGRSRKEMASQTHGSTEQPDRSQLSRPQRKTSKEMSLQRDLDDSKRRIQELEAALAQQQELFRKQQEQMQQSGGAKSPSTDDHNVSTKQGADVATTIVHVERSTDDAAATAAAARQAAREAQLLEEIERLKLELAQRDHLLRSKASSGDERLPEESAHVKTDGSRRDFLRRDKGDIGDAESQSHGAVDPEPVVMTQKCNCNVKGLQEENARLTAELEKAKHQISDLEAEVEELKRKLQELRTMVKASGVDPAMVDAMFKGLGILEPKKGGKVFERLYNDARERSDHMTLLLKLLMRNGVDDSNDGTRFSGAALSSGEFEKLPPSLQQAVAAAQAENATKFNAKLSDTPPESPKRAATAGRIRRAAPVGIGGDSRASCVGAAGHSGTQGGGVRATGQPGVERFRRAGGARVANDGTGVASPSLRQGDPGCASSGSAAAPFDGQYVVSPGPRPRPLGGGSSGSTAPFPVDRKVASADAQSRRQKVLEASTRVGHNHVHASATALDVERIANLRSASFDSERQAFVEAYDGGNATGLELYCPHCNTRLEASPSSAVTFKCRNDSRADGSIEQGSLASQGDFDFTEGNGEAYAAAHGDSGADQLPSRRAPACSRPRIPYDPSIFEEYCRARGALEAEIKVEPPARKTSKSFQLSHLLLGPLRQQLDQQTEEDEGPSAAIGPESVCEPQPTAACRRPGSGVERAGNSGTPQGGACAAGRPPSAGSIQGRPRKVSQSLMNSMSPRRRLQESESLPSLGASKPGRPSSRKTLCS